MILNVENANDSTKKSIRNNKQVQLPGDKVNIQNSIAFLCTHYKILVKDMGKAIPFAIAKNRNKQRM